MTPLQELWHINAKLLGWDYRHPFYIVGAVGFWAACWVALMGKVWLDNRREGK